MAPSRGQGWQNQQMYENVHPNLALVLLFVRTEVECRKGLFPRSKAKTDNKLNPYTFVWHRAGIEPRGSFLEGLEKFSHPKSCSKISTLINSALFYAHILNMNRGSLHARSFRRMYLFVFKYRLTKNGFAGPKNEFAGLPRNGPRPHIGRRRSFS